MSVTVTVAGEIQPGRFDEAIELLRKELPATRAREGCEVLTVHRNQDNPNQFMIVGVWASRPQHESYLAWRIETGVLNMLGEMLVGAPSFGYWDFVGA